MKRLAVIAAAALSICAGTAFAACPDQSASNSSGTDMGKTAAISKDGSHAPLETAKPPADAGRTVAKDGDTMPLASQEGGGNKDLATSQQDVEAQQEGGKTAAAQADDACKD